MRVLVLGGGGMLGHKLFQRLRPRFDVACTLRGRRTHPFFEDAPAGQVIESFDATDEGALATLLDARRPDVVINAVGLVKQRLEAQSPEPSIRVNALLPHVLRRLCAARAARLIHFSTDCVFSGRAGGYTEADVPDPEDLYGRTKALGEVDGPGVLTLRTSIIGRELSQFQSLLEWFMARGGGPAPGFVRAFYAGVTTLHLADLVAEILTRHREIRGVFQVASSRISKYDLLVLIKEAYGLDVEILPDDRVAVDRSLKADALAAAIGYRCPSWPDLVRELAADPTPYDTWRQRESHS